MANEDYLSSYRQFFREFAENCNLHDQLPVELGAFPLREFEVKGAVVDWCLQHLTAHRCPPSIITPMVTSVLDYIKVIIKEDESMINESVKLMRAVIDKLNQQCLGFLENEKLLNALPPPNPIYPRIISTCSRKNKRRTMEDRLVVIQDLNGLFQVKDDCPTCFYAVYDGHGGREAARYCAAHLHQFIVESSFYPSDPLKAMSEAFLRTDEVFNQKNCKKNVGTTAVCALHRLKEQKVYVAYVGDSDGYMFYEKKAPNNFVNYHRPTREDENCRITDLGGSVCFLSGVLRVQGSLTVTRSIGDHIYKPYVIAEPELAVVTADATADLLLLCSDGLTDVLSGKELQCFVYKTIKAAPAAAPELAQNLFRFAESEGSLDNISVVAVFLRHPTEIAESADLDKMEQEMYDDNSITPMYLACKKPHDENMGEMGQKEAAADVLSATEDGNKLIDEFAADFWPSFAAAQHEDEPELEKGTCSPAADLVKETNGSRREETPTPPADDVHLDSAVAATADNVGDSSDDSDDDEWNYYGVDPAKKDDKNQQPGSSADLHQLVVSDEEEQQEAVEEPQHHQQQLQQLDSQLQGDSDEDAMSQLNPDAAEFVPVSPTKITEKKFPDDVVSQSPKRPQRVGKLPKLSDFETEVKSRPSETFESFASGEQMSPDTFFEPNQLESMLLNGKNLNKNLEQQQLLDASNTEEESPQKQHDIECSLSSIEATFDPLQPPSESDPMNMSFYDDPADVRGQNPFVPSEEKEGEKTPPKVDLNAVHSLEDISDGDFTINTTAEEEVAVLPQEPIFPELSLPPPETVAVPAQPQLVSQLISQLQDGTRVEEAAQEIILLHEQTPEVFVQVQPTAVAQELDFRCKIPSLDLEPETEIGHETESDVEDQHPIIEQVSQPHQLEVKEEIVQLDSEKDICEAAPASPTNNLEPVLSSQQQEVEVELAAAGEAVQLNGQQQAIDQLLEDIQPIIKSVDNLAVEAQNDFLNAAEEALRFSVGHVENVAAAITTTPPAAAAVAAVAAAAEVTTATAAATAAVVAAPEKKEAKKVVAKTATTAKTTEAVKKTAAAPLRSAVSSKPPARPLLQTRAKPPLRTTTEKKPTATAANGDSRPSRSLPTSAAGAAATRSMPPKISAATTRLTTTTAKTSSATAKVPPLKTSSAAATAAATAAAATRPRVPLSARTASSSSKTSSTTTSTTAQRPTTLSSLKSTSARTTSSATTTTTRPRPTVTSRVASARTTAPASEKQLKDSTNKLLVSSHPKTTAGSGVVMRHVASRIDSGINGGNKLTAKTAKTTTATTQSLKGARPITKTSVTSPKAATKQNGVVSVVEEIATIQVVSTEEPPLLKDLSPVENNAHMAALATGES